MNLSIVATPIGNLKDITLRALEALQEADVVLCEDTRHTQKLLTHYGLKKRLISCHQHNVARRLGSIIDLLEQKKKLALVTDAGTPGISDPGNELICKLLEHFKNDLTITPLPGPSALTTLACVAGVNLQEFVFLGFPPHKKHRRAYFEKLASFSCPVFLYESNYRLVKTLLEISLHLPECHVIVGKELTKFYEKIYRGPILEVIQEIQSANPRGEYTLLVTNNE